jgi:hypothetical protein
MFGSSRVFLAALPAVAMLAACGSSPTATAPPPPGATSTAPATPMTSGALAANSGLMTALSGSTTPPETQPTRLDSAAIQSTLVNNTVTGLASNGETYYAWFGPTGQVHYEQGAVRDTGTWRTLPDGKLCSQMARHQADGEQCYTLYRSGSVMTFEQADGNTLGSFSVLPGNPQDL